MRTPGPIASTTASPEVLRGHQDRRFCGRLDHPRHELVGRGEGVCIRLSSGISLGDHVYHKREMVNIKCILRLSSAQKLRSGGVLPHVTHDLNQVPFKEPVNPNGKSIETWMVEVRY